MDRLRIALLVKALLNHLNKYQQQTPDSSAHDLVWLKLVRAMALVCQCTQEKSRNIQSWEFKQSDQPLARALQIPRLLVQCGASL